jgi:hypothetical protein
MTKLFLRTAENTYDTGVSGGTIPLANKRIDVVDWVMRLEPYETPMLSTIGIGESIDQDIFYWGQSYQTPQTSALSEALDASETDIDVTTNHGELFSKYMVIAVTDYQSGSSTLLDLDTRELMWLNQDVSNDTLNVVRGVGSSTAVTHSSGAFVEIVGSAMPQLNDFSITPITRGDQAFNYFQRFQTSAVADEAARHQPTYENPGDILLDDMAEKAKIEKIHLEKAIFQGGRQRGVPGVTPDMFGGIDTFLSTNVTDVGNARLSVYTIQDELRDLWKSVGDNKATKFVMGPDTASMFDTLLNPYRDANFSDTSANLTLKNVNMRFGNFDILMHRYCPEGIVYGLRFDKMKIHPFEGRNWQTKDIATDGPYDRKGLSGDFTFKLTAEHTMFKLHNFDVNPDSYPRAGYL